MARHLQWENLILKNLPFLKSSCRLPKMEQILDTKILSDVRIVARLILILSDFLNSVKSSIMAIIIMEMNL